MLFYNHNQEFIGIDEEGLKLLNYESLGDLLSVCSDPADLFAKEPGYIHNFKNFGWIDFLLHADSDATSAIVHGNGRTFSCTLSVHKLFLREAPQTNGYMIEMLHIQSLSGEEIRPHAVAPTPKPAPAQVTPPAEAQPVSPASSFEAVAEERYGESEPGALPDYAHIAPTPLSEPGTLDIPPFVSTEPEARTETAWEPETKLTLPGMEETAVPQPPRPATQPAGSTIRFSPAEQKFINELKVDRSYHFDPNVAAKELGLPVDLIQEFIGDFIQQSHDFKNDLFNAVMKGDMSNIKILSHKLKGVAANLRIEDAFENLSNINTSDDIIEIEANLKYFYGIIAKLEGKEADFGTAAEEAPSSETAPSWEEPSLAAPKSSAPIELDGHNDDDIYAFAFKEPVIDTPLVSETPAEETLPDFSYNESETLYEMPAKTFDDSTAEENPVFLQESVEIPAAEAGQILHYDKTTIAGMLGIEPSFLHELVEDYKHDAIAASGKIADAIASFDSSAWQETAKGLKGISDNLRLSEISEELSVIAETYDAQEAHKASARLSSLLGQL